MLCMALNLLLTARRTEKDELAMPWLRRLLGEAQIIEGPLELIMLLMQVVRMELMHKPELEEQVL